MFVLSGFVTGVLNVECPNNSFVPVSCRSCSKRGYSLLRISVMKMLLRPCRQLIEIPALPVGKLSFGLDMVNQIKEWSAGLVVYNILAG